LRGKKAKELRRMALEASEQSGVSEFRLYKAAKKTYKMAKKVD